MGLFPDIQEEAKSKGLSLSYKQIPMDVFDSRAVKKGEIIFHDVAYIEFKPIFKKRKLSNKKNINHIPFEYTFFELSMLKIYNRLFPIISIFLGNYKFKADYHMRNYINQRLTDIIEKNSDALLVPNVLLPS